MAALKPSAMPNPGKSFADAAAEDPPTPVSAEPVGKEKGSDRRAFQRTQKVRLEEDRLRLERGEKPGKRQRRREAKNGDRKGGELDEDGAEGKRQKLDDVGSEKTPGDVGGASDVEKEDLEVDGDRPSLVSAVQGIHWAPLDIPLPRRLQTGAVLWHTLSMSLFFAMFWFVLAVPLFWPLLLPYLIYVFIFANNHADGSVPYKRSEFLRNLPIWTLYAEYFPIRLHRTVELDPRNNYIFAYHPHGIISHGAFGNFVTEATGFSRLFPGITNTLLTLDTNFSIPFNREYLLALGLASVSKTSCEALLRGEGSPKLQARRSWINPLNWFFPTPKDLKKNELGEGGRAITIVIGGARESLEAQPGTMKLVCKKRQGFLKLAIREGASVVPVLSFGENDLYEQLVPGEGSWLRTAQMTLKKTLGFTVPLMHARGVFNYDVGLMPYRREINTVVGNPITPIKNPDPTERELEDFQERYIGELARMWNEWKDVFAKNRLDGVEGEMVIVE